MNRHQEQLGETKPAGRFGTLPYVHEIDRKSHYPALIIPWPLKSIGEIDGQ